MQKETEEKEGKLKYIEEVLDIYMIRDFHTIFCWNKIFSFLGFC